MFSGPEISTWIGRRSTRSGGGSGTGRKSRRSRNPNAALRLTKLRFRCVVGTKVSSGSLFSAPYRTANAGRVRYGLARGKSAEKAGLPDGTSPMTRFTGTSAESVCPARLLTGGYGSENQLSVFDHYFAIYFDRCVDNGDKPTKIRFVISS